MRGTKKVRQLQADLQIFMMNTSFQYELLIENAKDMTTLLVNMWILWNMNQPLEQIFIF